MKRPLLHPILRWVPITVWGGIILWLSLIPSPPVLKSELLGWDKFQHAVAYCLLTLLGVSSLDGLPAIRHRLLWASAGAMLFGAVVEAVQGVFTTTRTAEIGDLLADAAGAAVACVVRVAVRRRFKS
ncbi:MAG TPA: VanZ family protein [Geobacteraceae bacterium]